LADRLWFAGVWGLSENLVFVIGESGLSDILAKYENGDWTYVHGPRDDPCWFCPGDIHILPSGYGWAVGREYSYEYMNGQWTRSGFNNYGHTAVWVDGFRYGWACAADGKIWRLTELDGWYDVFEFPEVEFTDICVINSPTVFGDNGFVVGLKGAVAHVTGETEASEGDSGVSNDLWGVWGNAADAIYAVGDDGIIIRFDGELWRPMLSGTDANLYAVWGTSSTNVFAVGAGGTILKYNGNSWARMTSPTKETLRSVWGTSATNVYAVGSESTILRFGLDPQE